MNGAKNSNTAKVLALVAIGSAMLTAGGIFAFTKLKSHHQAAQNTATENQQDAQSVDYPDNVQPADELTENQATDDTPAEAASE